MHSLKQYKGSFMLAICAIIWGTSLVPQKLGMQYLGAFSFGAARFLTGAIIFLPLSLLVKRLIKEKEEVFLRKDLLIGGGLCGTVMFLGAYFQQLGLTDTTVGKTAFITSMYIVMIPLIGLFFHRKTEMITWVSIGLATVCLYFLCISENFSISKGDFYVFIGSVFWAVQITLVDYYSKKTNSLELVFVEFTVAGILSLVCAFQMEAPTIQAVTSSIGPILYTGIMVVGVAYTLQALGQKTVSPAIAGLIFSTESLFGVLAGALMFQEVMSTREIIGCILLFIALLLTQMKFSPIQKGKKQTIINPDAEELAQQVVPCETPTFKV